MTMLPLTKWYEAAIVLLLLALLTPVMVVLWPLTWVASGLRRRRLARSLN